LLGDDDEPTAAQTRAEIGDFVAPSANEPHFTANRANPVKCPSAELESLGAGGGDPAINSDIRIACGLHPAKAIEGFGSSYRFYTHILCSGPLQWTTATCKWPAR